jgi:hypothetical protein
MLKGSGELIDLVHCSITISMSQISSRLLLRMLAR